MSGGKLEIYRASWQRMMQLFGRLHAAGVPLVAGTDSLAGFMLHRELELYVQAGIPAGEAIRIATENGARYAGVPRRPRHVERGKRADLILVDGDPTRNISDIRKVSYVLKDGVGFAPAEIYEAVRDPALRGPAVDHPLSAARRLRPPAPSGRGRPIAWPWHEVDAHRARRLEHGDVLDLLGDQPEVQRARHADDRAHHRLVHACRGRGRA